MNRIDFDLDRYIAERKERIDDYLKQNVRLPSEFARLKEACEYALFPGGKRIRPILTIASCEAVGGDVASVMPFACAIELIHTYSLIHDDLPAIDNDELRRGKPTVHVAFGEAIAILAGDALLTEAFRLMSDVGLWEDVYHHEALEVINLIARCAGIRGMVGGQSLDVLWEGKDVDEQTVWQ
ncbi:MAG TPA: polyprenyl synthetase family protein, partial [Proteobacteria bacterium]|nr:polyprenyl synthetase family protein [Pseudomonadota bacterium]